MTAATPYVLPRETRESDVLVGNGTVGPYAASAYKVFDTVDVKVFAKALGETVFSDVTAGCTIAKVNPASAYDYFTVTFGAAVPATTAWYHQARRVAERSVAVTRGGTLDSNQLEKELSKQATAESELRRDLDRRAAFPRDYAGATEMPSAEAGKVLGWNVAGSKLENKSLLDLGQAVILDEDGLTSDRADAVPSQQSVKAYVDNGFIAGAGVVANKALARFSGLLGRVVQNSLSYLSDAGALRLGSNSAPDVAVHGIHVGTGAATTTGIGVLVAKPVVADTTGGYHPFSDGSTYNVPTAGGTAAASFDSTVIVTGTVDYNHFAGLQYRTTYGSTGTLDNMYGHVDLPAITAGTITNRYGSSIWDITKIGGVVTNNYGHYVKQLVNGINNWAYYSEGATKSFIGGITFDGVGGLFGITSQNTGQLAGFRNVLINGAMMVSQRGTSFTSTGSLNNSGNYTLDRWKLLSDGNNIANVSQSTATIPANGLNSILVLTATAAKKFGFLQVIEQKNIIGLLGKTVTLSFQASQGSNLAGYKAAILSWTGTADAPTNPISAWNADGTLPTLAANWTMNNAPVALGAIAASFNLFSVSATLNTASTKNVAVFIWCDDPANAGTGDPWAVADVQLEIGSVATPFERRPWEIELDLCKAYYQKSFAYATAPAEGLAANWRAGFGWSTTAIGVGFTPFSTTMRTAPAITFYKPIAITGTNGKWQWYDGVSAYQDSSATAVASFATAEGFDVNLTVTGATAKSAYIVQGHWVASAEL